MEDFLIKYKEIIGILATFVSIISAIFARNYYKNCNNINKEIKNNNKPTFSGCTFNNSPLDASYKKLDNKE